jgi:hypothetical protein
MLTGKQAFAAESISDIIARILKEDPGWTLLPDDLPLSFR